MSTPLPTPRPLAVFLDSEGRRIPLPGFYTTGEGERDRVIYLALIARHRESQRGVFH